MTMKALYALFLLSAAVSHAAMTTSWVTNADKSVSLMSPAADANWVVVGTIEGVSGVPGLPAPMIFGVAVTETNQTSARVAWGTDIVTFPNYVDFGTVDGVFGSTATAIDGLNHSVYLNGLSAGTSYQYRIRSYGNDQWSTNAPAWFATPTEAPTTTLNFADSLVGNWLMDDNTGANIASTDTEVAYYFAPQGSTKPQSVAGLYGNALSFNGTTAYGIRGDSDAFSGGFGRSYTISVWYKPSRTNAVEVVFCKAGTPNGSKEFRLINAQGALMLNVFTNAAANSATASIPGAFDDTNAWYNLQALIDATNLVAKVRFGKYGGTLGAWTNSPTFAGFGPAGLGTNTTAALSIGANGSGANLMQGTMDRTRFWRRALSESESQAEFAAGHQSAW